MRKLFLEREGAALWPPRHTVNERLMVRATPLEGHGELEIAGDCSVETIAAFEPASCQHTLLSSCPCCAHTILGGIILADSLRSLRVYPLQCRLYAGW